MDAFKRWIIDEANNRNAPFHKAIYENANWDAVNHGCSSPQQSNGVDCGIFTMMAGNFLSDDLGLPFCQYHIPFFRRTIAADILRGFFLYT